MVPQSVFTGAQAHGTSDRDREWGQVVQSLMGLAAKSDEKQEMDDKTEIAAEEDMRRIQRE
jgi:hypothetical protein